MSPSLSPAPDLTGRTIGRYRVLGPLGRGGMGLVYRAVDPRLGRHVAIKLLPAHLSNDAGAKKRLLVEARAASALDHPHICTVYEVGEMDDGTRFLAMACYEGRTLAEVLAERGALPVEEAVAIARQVASGLAAAHRKKIIHRDLKPSNIFLCDDEDGPSARILDFGVAKIEGTALTRPGATLGTVEYAAPEQVRGEVDDRSDLWALGVVLYEMLTGRRPFEGAYDAALLYAILNLDPEPMRAHRPEVPEAVEAVVRRLLQKDPADRFQSAAEVENALAGATAENASVSTARMWRRPRKVVLWSVSGVMGVLALGFALWGVRGDTPVLPEERHVAVLPFTVVGDDAEARAFSDGIVELVVSELMQLERYEGALEVVPMSEVRAQGIESAGHAHRAVGATLAVTGRVRSDSAGVEATIHLEDATTLRQVDARTLRRPATELNALRDDVIAALAQMLDVELRPEARAALEAGGTRSSAAFEAYVVGLGLLEGTTPELLGDAAAAFERAIQHDPRFALAHARLGEVALRMYQETQEGSWVERARVAVRTAIELNPDGPQGYVARARLLTTTGRYEEAVHAARQALSLEASDDAYSALADAYEAGGDIAAAEVAYQEAIARKPGAWRGYIRLGLFHYNHGRYEEALRAWQRVTRLAPDLARGYGNLGAAYLQLGQADSAAVMFEQAIARYPSYGVLSNLATLYYEDGRFVEAARTYRRALALDSQSYWVWGNLAAAYERLNDRGKAVAAYRASIHRAEAARAVNPNDPAVLVHLANSYLSVGDSVQSHTFTALAAAMEPEGENALYLALAYEQAGDREEALLWVDRALEGGVTPEDVESTHALAGLVADPRYRRGGH